ncbi:MAG: substrate-binding domain-containing protein, partial [Deltaproteobacteria bacterium]|nr:substrate-binding domain-containing protein [Deltaproteobacteria bacterium]
FPWFTKTHGIQVQVVSVGSGKALRLGAAGDVDLVLSHAPRLEQEYVQKGELLDRREVMVNHFILLAPPQDPAGAAKALSLKAALAQIRKTQGVFFSRGDGSGTHILEQKTWKSLGVVPQGEWYRPTGLGMGATLMIADEVGGYVICVDATYYAFKGRLRLRPVIWGDPAMKNPYSLLSAPSGAGVHHREAAILKEWMLSEEGQQAIGEFKVNGRRLFAPVKGGGK